MYIIRPQISKADINATSEIGVEKSYTNDGHRGFWWAFSYMSYVKKSEFRSKFVQFEIDEQCMFCLHIRKTKDGLWMSLFRAPASEDATYQHLPRLDVQLSFSDGFGKSQRMSLMPSRNIVSTWYYSGLWNESRIQQQNPYLRRCTVYCKLIAWDAIARSHILFQPFVTGDNIPFSDDDRIPKANSNAQDDGNGSPASTAVSECGKLAEALNFYRIAEKFMITSLMENCIDILNKKIDESSCLYFLKNCRDIKNSFMFKHSLDLFVLFFEDVCQTREWKQLKAVDLPLACCILMDAALKESDPLETRRYLTEMNSW